MTRVLSVVLMAIPSYLIVITVHEMGHILVGLAHGFLFDLLIVGPLGLRRNGEGRVELYIERNPTLWGGVAGVWPRQDDTRNLDAFARVLLAGPLTTLVFGAAFLTLSRLTDHPFPGLLGAIAVAISVATLIPLRSGVFRSDGGRWLRIVRNGRARVVESAMLRLVRSEATHGTCAHIDIADTLPLIDNQDAREQYLGHFYAMRHYRARDNRVMEHRHRLELERLAPSVPKSLTRLMAP